MTDPVIQQAETTAVGLGTKAIAWLKVHWYSFGIGAGVGYVLHLGKFW
jgi:hypothetical protein